MMESGSNQKHRNWAIIKEEPMFVEKICDDTE